MHTTAYKMFAGLFTAYFVVISTGSVILHQLSGSHSDCECLIHVENVHADCDCESHQNPAAGISEWAEQTGHSQHCAICEFFNQSFESDTQIELPDAHSLCMAPVRLEFDIVLDEVEFVLSARGPPLSV